MRIMFVMTLLIASIFPIQMSAQKALSGLTVIIDPGHGGSDPGSSRVHGETRINESTYTYDVSLRVAKLIREHGGIAHLTIKDTTKMITSPANKISGRSMSARFTFDNSPVHAGSKGLRKRVAFGNLMARKFPKSRIVWISIHFDVVGNLTETSGVRIIAADSMNAVARGLVKSFDDSHRLRARNPFVESGDPRYGIRDLYVLSSRNIIRNRVLIELGNFNNDGDAWKIRSPEVRDSYAQTIVRGLGQRTSTFIVQRRR